MYIIGVNDIDKVCRICFEVETEKKNLYLDKEWDNMSLADILLSCFQVKVEQHELITNMVCRNCTEEIYRIYEFKLKLEKSVKYWSEYLINVENDYIKKDDFLVVQSKNEINSSSTIEFSTESFNQVELDDHDNSLDDNSRSKMKRSELYICQQCQVAFVNKLQLMKHKRIFSHYKRKRVLCPKCKLLICTQNYKQHILKHADDYTCELCEKRFSSKFNLKRHIRIHTQETPFTCSVCNAKFARHDKLKAHKMIHLNEKQLSCTSDGINLINKWSLVDDMCSKAFTKPVSLRRHKLLHTEESLLCSECGKLYSNKSALKLHEQNDHDKVTVTSKEYLCNICAKLCSTKPGLERHIQTVHLRLRSYVCRFCQKSFTRPETLQLHYMIHTGEKPYACHICSKAFNKSHNLQRHMKTHTNEHPYKCTLCNKAFTTKQGLTVHIRTHTGERPFICPECNKSFIDCGTMNKHRKTHLKQPN